MQEESIEEAALQRFQQEFGHTPKETWRLEMVSWVARRYGFIGCSVLTIPYFQRVLFTKGSLLLQNIDCWWAHSPTNASFVLKQMVH